MSEPTPLTADEPTVISELRDLAIFPHSDDIPLAITAKEAESVVARLDSLWRELSKEVHDRNAAEDEIATLKAEIEGYRQALEKAHRDRIAQSNGYSCGCWWDNKDDEAPGGVTLIVSPDCWLQRVLAGKEAQGGQGTH